MTPHTISSPVSLSYAAALRGFIPRQPGSSFAYAVMGCSKPELLTCLAASNPEGLFYGFVSDALVATKAEEQARAQKVDNLFFSGAKPADILDKKFTALPQLNYLCVDESGAALTAAERTALFDIAKNYLLPGGIFQYTYRAYSDADGPLRFLVRELAPEMAADQAQSFLKELKTLGRSYLAKNAHIASKLDDAFARKMPDAFFETYENGEARSAAFDTIVALRPRGFTYAGDSHISDNYIDFAVAPDAQDIILSCRDNHLYEPLKDYALNRIVRSDIWCHEPAPRSGNLAELFGGFTYGIVMPRDQVPEKIKTIGQTIDLSSLLYQKLINLMTLIPVSVGDFLSHPDGKGFLPNDVVGAIQVLAACGIVQPMRGTYRNGKLNDMAQPRFAGAFNRSLGHKQLSGEEIFFASPVLGTAVSVSAHEALVMQALDRAGLANSVSALMPELERLTKNPALSIYLKDAASPTAIEAQDLIKDTVSRSIVQWYAYGLLEAA